MEVGLVHKVDIDNEMQQAYLDYAMSVIVARALPDARDGLKPVHRRILYAMYDMGLRADTPYKKSARIVGEVLGKYHPHGDMAVYDAMARMAQDFSMRYLLVDGQGNFGSVDGDPPAAMRYTEARLAAPAMNMLTDINKDTVDFDDNFDGTLTEPSVLPAALPNLLVNGATGIAVGMATSIPPHNLGEVVEASKYMLEHWTGLDDINVDNLMQFIQGPDFPTGGVILQEAGSEEGLASAYGTGRGRVTVQARAHLEEMERGRNRIIVNELPYMTNKSSLIERIADLVREERIEGIVDLRDESDRQGMRIVIELSKAADPERVLRDLYKHTPMQSTFSIIMLALVDGEPRMLSLKQALRVYIEHRLEIVRRRSVFDLERARQRAHILEGLRVALKNLDEVIEMIRKAPDVETARARLMKRFKLSEVQATAILDMPLRRLAALERRKIEEEYKEVQALIKELEGLLRSPKKMREAVASELEAVKQAYGDRRRTQIVHMQAGEPKVNLLTTGDLTPDKNIWIAVTADGLISRSLDERPPAMEGEGAATWLVQASTRHTLYLACEEGEAAAIPVHSVPEAEQPSQGIHISKVSALRNGNRLAGLFSLPAKNGRLEDWFVLTVTRQGMVKKSALSELPGPSANTFTLAKVNEGDRLGWVRLTDGKKDVLLATESGMAIRFSEEEVRPMGLVAAGVMGIKLQAEDQVAGAETLPRPGEVFLLATDGSAKRVPADQFPKQGRYGQGVSAWKLPLKAKVVGMAVGRGSRLAAVRTENLPAKEIRLDEAPLQTRAARGHMIAGLKAGGGVIGLILARGMVLFDAENGEQETTPPEADGGKGKAAPKAKSPAKPTADGKGQASRGAPKTAPKAATNGKGKAEAVQPPVKSRGAAAGEPAADGKAKTQSSAATAAPKASEAGKGKAAAGTKPAEKGKFAASGAKGAAASATSAPKAAKGKSATAGTGGAKAGTVKKDAPAATAGKGKAAPKAAAEKQPAAAAKPATKGKAVAASAKVNAVKPAGPATKPPAKGKAVQEAGQAGKSKTVPKAVAGKAAPAAKPAGKAAAAKKATSSTPKAAPAKASTKVKAPAKGKSAPKTTGTGGTKPSAKGATAKKETGTAPTPPAKGKAPVKPAGKAKSASETGSAGQMTLPLEDEGKKKNG